MEEMIKLSEVAVSQWLSGQYTTHEEVAAGLGHRKGSKGHAVVMLTLKNHVPDGAQFCNVCRGTGIYKGTRVTGKCYSCNGKGYTLPKDRAITEHYWSRRAAKEIAGDMA